MNRPCRIVRKESGEDWRAYLQRLAAAEGLELKTREELARFDKQRKKAGKKTASNDEWESKTDADARIRKSSTVMDWVGKIQCQVRSAKSEVQSERGTTALPNGNRRPDLSPWQVLRRTGVSWILHVVLCTSHLALNSIMRTVTVERGRTAALIWPSVSFPKTGRRTRWTSTRA